MDGKTLSIFEMLLWHLPEGTVKHDEGFYYY